MVIMFLDVVASFLYKISMIYAYVFIYFNLNSLVLQSIYFNFNCLVLQSIMHIPYVADLIVHYTNFHNYFEFLQFVSNRFPKDLVQWIVQNSYKDFFGKTI